MRTIVDKAIEKLGTLGAAGLFAGIFMLTGATLGFGIIIILGCTAIALSLYFSESIPAVVAEPVPPAPAAEEYFLQGLIEPIVNAPANIEAAANRFKTVVEIIGASFFALSFLFLGATLGLYMTVAIELFTLTYIAVGYVNQYINHRKTEQGRACVYGGGGSAAVVCKALDLPLEQQRKEIEQERQEIAAARRVLEEDKARYAAQQCDRLNEMAAASDQPRRSGAYSANLANLSISDNGWFNVELNQNRRPSPFDI